MIAIKITEMDKMPEGCDSCVWFGNRPPPAKGWTEQCELMCKCLDDGEPKEWIYDGNGRPKACPLIEIKECSE